jgi:putative ABC transport system substrate-binding protein
VNSAPALALLHELAPGTATIGFLGNPINPTFELTMRDLLAAASIIGLKIEMLKAGTDSEIDAAFESAVQARTGALLVQGDTLFITRIERVIGLAARHQIPAMYPYREFAVVGGLISYGTSLAEAWRQIGLYTGRILKGEKPADLPVQQFTKVELTINLKTAKTLGIQVPATLLALADEVIE